MVKNNPPHGPPASDYASTMRTLLQLPIRILTHNIRYATTSPFKGEEPWAIRAPLIVNELHYHTQHNAAAFVCLQEVLSSQLQDVLIGLNARAAEWSYIGVGRDDGRARGEFSPILFRPRAWTLLHFETLWLSETPDRPSRGWDASLPRIATIGVFRERGPRVGRVVVGMSTHFDDQGSRAREEGAKLILKKIVEIKSAWGDPPVFLAGDLNSEPGEEAYSVFSSEASVLRDVRDQVPREKRYADEMTFTGFPEDWNDTSKATRIDYIFLSKDEEWSVDGYSVLPNRFENGVYNSDHRAVVADVAVRSQPVMRRGGNAINEAG